MPANNMRLSPIAAFGGCLQSNAAIGLKRMLLQPFQTQLVILIRIKARLSIIALLNQGMRGPGRFGKLWSVPYFTSR